MTRGVDDVVEERRSLLRFGSCSVETTDDRVFLDIPRQSWWQERTNASAAMEYAKKLSGGAGPLPEPDSGYDEETSTYVYTFVAADH